MQVEKVKFETIVVIKLSQNFTIVNSKILIKKTLINKKHYQELKREA